MHVHIDHCGECACQPSPINERKGTKHAAAPTHTRAIYLLLLEKAVYPEADRADVVLPPHLLLQNLWHHHLSLHAVLQRGCQRADLGTLQLTPAPTNMPPDEPKAGRRRAKGQEHRHTHTHTHVLTGQAWHARVIEEASCS
jgi:hypothetical protein